MVSYNLRVGSACMQWKVGIGKQCEEYIIGKCVCVYDPFHIIKEVLVMYLRI